MVSKYFCHNLNALLIIIKHNERCVPYKSVEKIYSLLNIEYTLIFISSSVFIYDLLLVESYEKLISTKFGSLSMGVASGLFVARTSVLNLCTFVANKFPAGFRANGMLV